MFSKEPKEKYQEDVSKTGNGYHQDPEMNHGPLRGRGVVGWCDGLG